MPILGFRGQYGWQLHLALVVAGLAVVLGAVLAARRRRDRQAVRIGAARILLAGAIAVVFIGTVLPEHLHYHRYGFGNLTLGLGDGPLGDLGVLSEFPDTLASVLLVGNVVLYVPLGALAVLSARRTWMWPLVVPLVVSVSAETAQYVLGVGHAATDDVVLNVLGGLVGFAIGLAIRHALTRPSARSVVTVASDD